MCELIKKINNFFIERHILLNEEWLKYAIEYVRSITGENDVSANIVYELWKFSDIKESTQPCISENIKNAKNFTGSLVLQIQSILDIGTSYLNQFKKLVYVSTDNAEFVIKDQNNEKSKNEGSRLFQLVLTDGVTSIKAVEYIKVEQFTLLICPGSKILLHGNFKARRGVFLLMPDNCQLLGGDVEALMKTNRPVEIMSFKLGIAVPTLIKPDCAQPHSNQNSLISQRNNNLDQTKSNFNGPSVSILMPLSSTSSLHQSTLRRKSPLESTDVDCSTAQTSIFNNSTHYLCQNNKFSNILQKDRSSLTDVDTESSALSISNNYNYALPQNSFLKSIQNSSVIQDKSESKVDYNLNCKCSDLSLSHNNDDSTLLEQNGFQLHSNDSYGLTLIGGSNIQNNKNAGTMVQFGDNDQKLSILLDKMNEIAIKLDEFIKMASSYYKK